MINFKKISMVLLSFMVLSACNIADNENKAVENWDDTTTYKAGQFVQQGNTIFRATASSRRVVPNSNVSSQQNPLGAWARSSLYEFQVTQRRLAVTTDGSVAPLSSLNLSDIPYWNTTAIYHGNDLVRTTTGYYKSMWWNQGNDPNIPQNKNNYSDSEGTLHWGPWVTLTADEALEHLKQQQEGVKPPVTDPDPDGDNGNEGDGNGNGGNETIDPPTGEVTPDVLHKFKWDSSAIYLENDLAVVSEGSNRFFRSKWWNQNHSPLTHYEFAWDSPWEEISETRFQEIVENGGVTPPTEKPKPPVPTPDPDGDGGTTTPPVAPEFEEIHEKGYIQEWAWEDLPTRYKDAFNNAALNGNDILTSQGDAAVALFSSKINSERWELLFPRRRGSRGWTDNTGQQADDYYSYENFLAALSKIGDYAYLIEVALDPNSLQETSFERNYILHKPTRTVRLISQSTDYFAANNEWLTSRPHKFKVVDYAAFGSEGSANDKARNIAGFLAHASHETSGSWATAPGMPFDRSKFPGANFPDYITSELPGILAWSLYFNEEVHYTGSSDIGYVDHYNKIFPPTPGKSYHGRGAFQLSWNYNYGLASAIFFGTSKVLLDRPEFIINGGTVPSGWIAGERINGGTMAFLTSLMFWLTPQGPKPSQQDTMILNTSDGRYVAGTAKLNAQSGLGTPGYGWTINIMNGGFEAGKSWEQGHAKYDAKVERRVKHYIFFTQSLGGNNNSEVLDTVGLHPY